MDVRSCSFVFQAVRIVKRRKSNRENKKIGGRSSAFWDLGTGFFSFYYVPLAWPHYRHLFLSYYLSGCFVYVGRAPGSFHVNK